MESINIAMHSHDFLDSIITRPSFIIDEVDKLNSHFCQIGLHDERITLYELGQVTILFRSVILLYEDHGWGNINLSI